MLRLKLALPFLLFFTYFSVRGQVIDKVIGVVSKYPILLSDLQSAMVESQKQDRGMDRCQAFEAIIFQKLLIAQADRDSVTLSDGEVERELAQRMSYFIQQFGSEEKLEAFYGKRINLIKEELKADVSEQVLAEKMKNKISGDYKLTPGEVRQFCNSIPADSLPLVSSEVELQQITLKPTFSPEAREEVKAKLESYRQEVLKNGGRMSILARLYSDDQGSAHDGGLISNVPRGLMDPAFEAVMFRLKKDEVSTVFESAYGYHFIQLVARKGDLLDIRHILLIPKMTNSDFIRCKQQLDTISNDIKEGKISFEAAAKKYSDDLQTKQNGGLMINSHTASTKFTNEDLDQMDRNLVLTLTNMRINEISRPMEFTSQDNHRGFRLLKLKNRIDPHKTNLKDDYQKLLLMATAQKNRRLIKEWIRKSSKITYIKLDQEYACKFNSEWTINN